MINGELKPTLRSVLSDRPDRTATRAFVDTCFRMALVYLKRKARSGKLDADFFGLSLEDLTLDCIADLFERDEEGRFLQLVGYYESYDLEKTGEKELLFATRRLVFSKVSEGLFRRYRETDASLGKMIRNLRYNAERVKGVREKRLGGELYLLFAKDAASDVRPLMAPELMEARLMPFMRAGIDLQEVLRAVERVLQAHPEHRMAYPLTGLASIVESAFQRLAEPPQPAQPRMEHLHAEDIRRFIESCKQAISDKMRPKYVGKKVTKSTFDAYFKAVGDILHAQCIEDDGTRDSHYDHLRAYLPPLTYNDYRQNHRTRLEYVVKQTREQFLEQMERNW